MTDNMLTLLLSIVTATIPLLSVTIPIVLNARMKDTKDAATMSAAVKNSLGAIEQAAKGQLVTLHAANTYPDVPYKLLPGVAYALDHAGTEFARAKITPLAVASKINAQIGLAAIAAAKPPAVGVTLP